MNRVEELVRKNAKDTVNFFGPSAAVVDLPVAEDEPALMLRMTAMYNDLYRGAHEREKASQAIAAARGVHKPQEAAGPEKRARTVISEENGDQKSNGDEIVIDSEDAVLGEHSTALPVGMLERVEHSLAVASPNGGGAVVRVDDSTARARGAAALVLRTGGMRVSTSVAERLALDRPTWHAPWKMYRTISGHLGWVRCATVDASNEWFATGSADRTIKIWSVASGKLRLTLTGHVAGVRAIASSSRHPYLFSAGEDKTVKCWDLEQNKVVRSYHGHLSGVYALALHPTLNVLATGGRDSAVRIWDMRTRAQVLVLGGHRDAVNALISQKHDPQFASASVDSTVRLWDLAAGKTSCVLTNHKRGVRALAANPSEFSFASVSADAIKTWAYPNGTFIRNMGGVHKKLVNCLAINEDGVLVSGGDDGNIGFWDYASAHCFQSENTIVQPGSLDCEAGVYGTVFDKSGSRLITCEADKTIKMWKEDVSATPETHPLNWKPDLRPKRY